jgi:hypothetical protein
MTSEPETPQHARELHAADSKKARLTERPPTSGVMHKGGPQVARAPPDHDHPQPFTPLELERVAGMPEVERLTNLSSDTIKKHYREYLVHVSPRRIGMRIKHVLVINSQARA